MRLSVLLAQSTILLLGMTMPLWAERSENLQRGISLCEERRYAEAQICFANELAANPDNWEALYYLSKINLEQGNLDAAIQGAEKLTETGQENSAYFSLLGKAYLYKLQTVSFYERGILAGRVLENLKKAIELDPGNIEARILLANYYVNAPVIAGGSIRKAKEQAEEITKYSPNQGRGLMAQIYTREENYAEAILEYSAILESEPDNADIYYQLGMLYQQMKSWDHAFESFEKAVKVDPDAYESLYQIGRTAVFSARNLEQGIASLKKYLLTEPGQGLPTLDAAHWRLGMLYAAKGDQAAARIEFETALKMKPGDEKYMESLNNLSVRK
jgi:tetratricopeptide (TPR) repeat protein